MTKSYDYNDKKRPDQTENVIKTCFFKCHTNW
jgi:hypothetical protein